MIGQLRDRVEIQNKTTTKAALGVTVSYTEQAVRWARVVLLSPKMQENYRHKYGEVTHKIIMRTGDIDIELGSVRLIWKNRSGKTLIPAGPAFDASGLSDYTQIVCKEGDGAVKYGATNLEAGITVSITGVKL